MRTPAARQAPRVPRSRRDDRYQPGHPTPIKRAAAGWVLSVQDDTVTVTVSEEELTGVIPLGEMPPVGAIVEVEARGDLLVIPTWFEGPVASTAVVEFSNYTSDGGGTPAPVIVGADPWGDSDAGTYTESRINRTSISTADGWEWKADIGLAVAVPPVITGITFSTDIVATNGGSSPGSALRSMFVIRDAADAYVGEFNNNPGGGFGATPLGVIGTGDGITADWRDATGETSSLAGLPAALDGGHIEVRRYDNFVAPYSGNYTLRCNRITITITY